MSYSERINRIIASLNDQGLDKVASEISEVKEAMFSGVPLYDKPHSRPPMHSERALMRAPHTPSDPNIPIAKRGEPVIELDPVTGKERVILWGIDKPMTKKEIADEIQQGAMTEERLTDQYSRGNQQVKKFLAPLIEMTQERPQAHVPYMLGRKFAYISDRLEKCGYTLLVKKFNTAVEEYKKVAAESNEDHKVPSIEKVYEKSKSPKDFGKEIKKFIGVHDKIIDLVKKFDDKFETEVVDKIESKKISESDAVKKTVKLVNEVDTKADSEINKIS